VPISAIQQEKWGTSYLTHDFNMIYAPDKWSKKREETENRQVCKTLPIFLCKTLPSMVKRYIEVVRSEAVHLWRGFPMRVKNRKPHLGPLQALVFSTAFFGQFAAFPALAADEMRIQCEVLEVSGVAKTHVEPLKEVHFMIIHHASAADRQKLSRWLKAGGGGEVRFAVAGNVHQGVLYRLANCFGRGLLMYAHKIGVRKGDILDLRLPLKPSR
jgi:hypothetical protein